MASYLQNLFALDGSVAVVTGGTRGIGQAMALALAGAGADIILVQRNESNLETKNKVEALGRKAFVYVADLASQDAVAGLTERILKDGHDIDILVTCGGIQRRHPAHEFPMSDWDEVCFSAASPMHGQGYNQKIHSQHSTAPQLTSVSIPGHAGQPPHRLDSLP